MKKLMFIVLGLFVMSVFTMPTEEDLNNLKNTLQESKEERDGLDAELFQAVNNGDNDEVDILLAEGANPNARMNLGGEEDMPVIFLAISKKFPGIVKSLANRGADVNIDYEEETPLFFAINNTEYDQEDPVNLEIVRNLLRFGKPKVDLYKLYDFDSFSGSVLILAVQKRQFKIIDALLMRGGRKLADMQSPATGYTALMYAIDGHDLKMVNSLLLYKFDLGVRDNDGRNAMKVAQDNIDELTEQLKTNPDDSNLKDALKQAKSIKQALQRDLVR